MICAAIDSHVHVGGTYEPIETYVEAMSAHGLDRAVLVQQLGATEHSYLEKCLAADPGRYAAVAVLSPDCADPIGQLARLVDRGFIGARLPPTGIAHAGAVELWDAMDDLGLVISVTGPFSDIVHNIEPLLGRIQRATVRLEHLGWLHFREAEDVKQFDRFLALAEHPCVTTTWSGFFLSSNYPHPHVDAWWFLEQSLQHFGAERIMWSGDWNRPRRHIDSYAEAIRLIGELPFLDVEQRREILIGTPTRTFWKETA